MTTALHQLAIMKQNQKVPVHQNFKQLARAKAVMEVNMNLATF